jgi:transcriptional regulator with XRE-family HTH domain
MSFTAAQCRAARALIGWSQADLADAAGVTTKTVSDFERGERTPYGRTLADIGAALELARIEFTNGGNPGVRVRGDKAFGHLYDEAGRHVGWINNGELRAGRDRRLVALVKDGKLHDPETGEFICLFGAPEGKGVPLPDALKSRL